MNFCPFGNLLHQLRLENKESTMKHQADLFGISTRMVLLLCEGELPVKEEWPDLVKAEYHMSDSDYEKYMSIYSGNIQDIFSALEPLTPIGSVIKKTATDESLSFNEFCSRAGFVPSFLVCLCEGKVALSSGSKARLAAAFPNASFDTKTLVSAGVEDIPPLLSVSNSNARTFSMVGRTASQRFFFWFLLQHIHSLDGTAIKELNSEIAKAKLDSHVVEAGLSPIGLCIHGFIIRGDFPSLKAFSKEYGIPYQTFMTIISGKRKISQADFDRIFPSLQRDGVFSRDELWLFNEMSAPHFSGWAKPEKLNSAQTAFLDKVFQKLAFMTDILIDSLTTILLTHVYSLALPDCPKSPKTTVCGPMRVEEIITRLASKNGETVASLAKKLNVSRADLSSMMSGLLNFSFSLAFDVASAYSLPWPEKYALVMATISERRFMRTDTLQSSQSQREALSFMMDSLFYLTDNGDDSDVEKIIAICKDAISRNVTSVSRRGTKTTVELPQIEEK